MQRRAIYRLLLIALSCSAALFCPAVMSFPARAAIHPIIAPLLQFHPSWINRTVTSHDQWGGNGDGNFFGGTTETFEGQSYKVLFHDKGEGRISRFLISARPEEIERDFRELVIVIDGAILYQGGVTEFFNEGS